MRPLIPRIFLCRTEHSGVYQDLECLHGDVPGSEKTQSKGDKLRQDKRKKVGGFES